MRELELYIFSYREAEPIEWGILEVGYTRSDKDYNKNLNKKYQFATLLSRDDKLKMAFCISFDKNRLETTSKEPMFDEVCMFRLNIMGKSSSKKMSIKEAFKVIYEKFGSNK